MNRPLRSFLAFAAPLLIAPALASAQPTPTFSDPLRITNPFYPTALQRYTVALGHDGPVSLRTEDMLLPDTISITWSGGTTECLVTQFVAYVDGDLAEVAYDFFAQSDDGTVYYFGEDVFNYEDGEIVNTHGTWRAGRDGAPPGIIMSASPFVGQVFHPEDFAPVVWEEDTVVSLNYTVMTPAGLINNGLHISEELLDGNFDFKIYARGFGEVSGGNANEVANMALFVGTGAPRRRIPSHLDAAESRVEEIRRATSNWPRIRANAMGATRAWNQYRGRASRDGVPAAFVLDGNAALTRLTSAIAARDTALTREAANEFLAAIVDISSAYNPRVPADIKRLEVLEHELLIDARTADWTAAKVEHAKAVDAVWARLRPFVLRRGDGAENAEELDELFANQGDAVDAQDLGDTQRSARAVLEAIEDLEDVF